jgi:hypothetical protein
VSLVEAVVPRWSRYARAESGAHHLKVSRVQRLGSSQCGDLVNLGVAGDQIAAMFRRSVLDRLGRV